MCARHIYANLKAKFPGKARMKPLFWAVAESYNMADYEEAIEEVKKYDLSVFEAMMEKNPKNCSRAYFTDASCCEDVHNNFAESYNMAINKARAMPLVEMLETIRRQTMIRIDLRMKKSLQHRGNFSLKATKMIEEEEKELKYCTLIPSAHGQFEVAERGCSYKVNVNMRTCTCRKWDITGIPCRHGLKAILKKKVNVEDYVSTWYLTSKWQGTYNDSIKPLNGMRFWKKSNEDKRIQPPPVDVSKGPKKKQKRIKGKHESPKKSKVTKASKEGRTSHCGRCGFVGHNSRRCTNVGVEIRRPTKKTQGVSDTIPLSHGDGPSQPSQNN